MDDGSGTDAPPNPSVVAPFSKDPREAAARAFDRETGKPVSQSQLLTLREALAQYHLHPETKFEGGDYLESGHLRRLHVAPLGPIGNIGKEANRWEEQSALGVNPSAQISYGASPGEATTYRREMRRRIAAFSVRSLSAASGISIGTVSNIRRGVGIPKPATMQVLDRALTELERASGDRRIP
jgi:hypothetical protein